METNLSYDFSEILDSISAILECENSENGICHETINKSCQTLRIHLNKFFKDRVCEALIYTTNTDAPFFGMTIVPSIVNYQDLIKEDMDNEYFERYTLELDSKLFTFGENPITASGILSMILYNIDKLTYTETYKELKTVINSIAVGLDASVELLVTEKTDPVFRYCVCETLNKMINICNQSTEGLSLASEIVRNYGFTEDFDETVESIQCKRDSLEKDNTCPTLCLNWFFYMANSGSIHDKLPIYTLRQGIASTGSSILKNLINMALRKLGDVDMTNTYVEEGKKKSLLNNIKSNGMKSIEDDLYEYSMRIKNIDDESSAILLMRQINSRIGIIADYLEQEDLTDFERKRYEKLYERYDKLREEMVKKPIYSRKMYGLFVDYNALMNMSNQNTMTMNTMY